MSDSPFGPLISAIMAQNAPPPGPPVPPVQRPPPAAIAPNGGALQGANPNLPWYQVPGMFQGGQPASQTGANNVPLASLLTSGASSATPLPSLQSLGLPAGGLSQQLNNGPTAPNGSALQAANPTMPWYQVPGMLPNQGTALSMNGVPLDPAMINTAIKAALAAQQAQQTQQAKPATPDPAGGLGASSDG